MDKSTQVIVEKAGSRTTELEWVWLMRSAKEAGIPVEDVRNFLRMKRQPERLKINIR